ncbi:MAG: substrate-binding domain-containing protein [Planctomycetes bacterium]|nr:substrate-binding domain-containing protein [Planctomycetota bacterium]
MNRNSGTFFFRVPRLFHLGVLGLLLSIGCADSAPHNGASSSSSNGSTARRKLVVAMVPKATTHEFWKSVRAGAVRGSKAADVELLWKGPLSENDREGQINVVQDFITRRVDGICLAPLDSRALVSVVQEAKGEKIPTLVFDSGLDDTSEIVSTVATDNFHGGEIAAREMGRLLEGKGNVLVLRYTPGSESTNQREDGFLHVLRGEFPEIAIVSEDEYAGATAESALDKSQQLLVKYGDKVQGIFTPCEHVTLGMLRALQERELAGKIKFLGFDSSPRLVDALRAGTVHGLVLQDPVRMAELAVITLAAHLRGEKVESRIATGESLVTRENMDSQAMQRLLKPETYED